ncbi:hypothetical protein ACCS69_35575, partial [Rhizobium johnstonii]|uniref:hypothetical protein n=1 Tax=Rhizobium johnstonii TaxID=3019933 RepID=UPI003F9E7892
GATNGHQRSTLLPAKPAAPSNLPHLRGSPRDTGIEISGLCQLMQAEFGHGRGQKDQPVECISSHPDQELTEPAAIGKTSRCRR